MSQVVFWVWDAEVGCAAEMHERQAVTVVMYRRRWRERCDWINGLAKKEDVRGEIANAAEIQRRVVEAVLYVSKSSSFATESVFRGEPRRGRGALTEGRGG